MHLLFVCTGNTCRSPMAEGIARQLVDQRGITDLTVGSAGTNAWEGAVASDGSLLVSMEHGIDLSQHRASLLSAVILRDSAVVLVMGESHLERVAELGAAERAWLLSDFATRGEQASGVSDPFGSDLARYRAVFDEVQLLVEQALDRIVADQFPRLR